LPGGKPGKAQVEKNQAGYAQQVVQLHNGVDAAKPLVTLGGIHPDLPYTDAAGFHQDKLFIQQVNKLGVEGPKDKKQRGILNVSPAVVPDQSTGAEPENQNRHGKNKKQVIACTGTAIHVPAINRAWLTRELGLKPPADAFQMKKGSQFRILSKLL